MSDRPVDRYREEREKRHRAYLDARRLRDEAPHVEQVTIELTFSDFSGMSNYSPQTRTFSPAATAFFEFPCPSSACTGGGFDLGRIVSNLISRKGNQSSGTLDCQGRQSGDEHDGHRSQLQLHYHIKVVYSAPNG